MQEDDLRQGSNIVTQARTTTAYSPAAESIVYPTRQEGAEEEAIHLQRTRAWDGRQRQGKQPMTAEEQMRDEEERRKRESELGEAELMGKTRDGRRRRRRR